MFKCQSKFNFFAALIAFIALHDKLKILNSILRNRLQCVPVSIVFRHKRLQRFPFDRVLVMVTWRCPTNNHFTYLIEICLRYGRANTRIFIQAFIAICPLIAYSIALIRVKFKSRKNVKLTDILLRQSKTHKNMVACDKSERNSIRVNFVLLHGAVLCAKLLDIFCIST